MDDVLFAQSQIYPVWLTWLGAVGMLWLPGMLLARLLCLPRSSDALLQFALQIGLGLAFWPVLFLWTSTLGWRWSPAMGRATVLLLGVAGLLDWAWVSPEQWRARFARLRRSAD